MKFVILNQPTKNKGDYAAFKAIVNLIKTKYPSATIECLFTSKEHDPLFDNVDNVNCIDFGLFDRWRITKVCLQKPILFKFLQYLPGYKNYSSHIRNADVAILAPGGLEIGAYQDWSVLWSLAIARSFEVKYAIYSRSIGKFVNNSELDRFFINQSIKCLQSSKFNGLREKKSQELAGMLGLNYFPAIDVVYSNTPNNVLDSKLIGGRDSNYAVFVPSRFNNWHPDFDDQSQTNLDELYKKIISKIVENGQDVVMLPHTYGRGDNADDSFYFESLIDSQYKNNCIIVDDRLDTDEYQAIIREADFAISARLHQVIFAINNHTPTICLSYEHKMAGMMEMLGLSDFSRDLNSAINSHEALLPLLEEFLQGTSQYKTRFINAKAQAAKQAKESFENFVDCIE